LFSRSGASWRCSGGVLEDISVPGMARSIAAARCARETPPTWRGRATLGTGVGLQVGDAVSILVSPAPGLTEVNVAQGADARSECATRAFFRMTVSRQQRDSHLPLCNRTRASLEKTPGNVLMVVSFSSRWRERGAHWLCTTVDANVLLLHLVWSTHPPTVGYSLAVRRGSRHAAGRLSEHESQSARLRGG